jgi:hypothetical protein
MSQLRDVGEDARGEAHHLVPACGPVPSTVRPDCRFHPRLVELEPEAFRLGWPRSWKNSRNCPTSRIPGLLPNMEWTPCCWFPGELDRAQKASLPRYLVPVDDQRMKVLRLRLAEEVLEVDSVPETQRRVMQVLVPG